MRWISRLNSTFGFPFLLLITSIYWTQGFRSFVWMGVSYQMKDELKLSPSASQFVISTAFLPWSVKPLYGIFSDCVPIRGRRRIPYMIISSILCFIPWFILGVAQASRSSYLYLTVLLTIQNFGAAMADVVVDAMVAETARQERAEFAGDLQSLSWLAMAIGGILGSITGGVALDVLNVNGIFVLFSMFPLLQLLSCAFLDEKSLGNANNLHDKGENLDAVDGQSGGAAIEDDSEEVALPEKLSTSSEEEDWVQVESSALQEVTHDYNRKLPSEESSELRNSLRGSEDPMPGLRRRKMDAEIEAAGPLEEEKVHDKTLRSTIRLACLSLYQAVKQPSIFRPMLWFLISQSAIPNLSTILFYYQTNFLKLDASFLGTSRVVGWGGLMLGTFLYNRYLKRVSLRKIFRWVHIGVAVLTLSDIVLVSRLNTRLGIPDKAFVLGASAIGDAVTQFKFMPFLVFSGQICPPGIEGTLFALFMSINNLGGTISSFAGATLASALHISSDEFGNLALGIFIQAICTILPIFLIFLIPEEATGTVAR